MTKAGGAGLLIAIDGAGQTALQTAARAALAALPRASRGGISEWDASGIFGDLAVAGDEAGLASARTLLLLYAADLAFRLRWEIRPAMQKKRCVVAAPYVATAMAFGRAEGLDEDWLRNLFAFAPEPGRAETIAKGDRAGFVEFLCGRRAVRPGGMTARELRERIAAQLGRPPRRVPAAPPARRS